MIGFGDSSRTLMNISGVAQETMSSMEVTQMGSNLSKETVVMTLFGHTVELKPIQP